MEESRVETLLNALIKGETIDFEPQSRMEEYLKNCINKTGVEGLPTPQSRVDALLYSLADKLSGSGGSGSDTVGVWVFNDEPTLPEGDHSYKFSFLVVNWNGEEYYTVKMNEIFIFDGSVMSYYGDDISMDDIYEDGWRYTGGKCIAILEEPPAEAFEFIRANATKLGSISNGDTPTVTLVIQNYEELKANPDYTDVINNLFTYSIDSGKSWRTLSRAITAVGTEKIRLNITEQHYDQYDGYATESFNNPWESLFPNGDIPITEDIILYLTFD